MKTFEQWNDAGYRIRRGAKSRSRNNQGVALFSREQVYLPQPAPSRSSGRRRYSYWAYWDDDDIAEHIGIFETQG